MSAVDTNNDGLADGFLDVFRRAALQAGAVSRYLQAEIRLREKKGKTPESAALTAVDLAAQDVLLLALHDAMPEVAIDTEEDTETVSLFPPEEPGRPLVVVDPIDGTLNYSRGSRDYAVMGALVVRGRYEATVVHYPAWQETYWARRGGGCWRQRRDEDAERVRVAVESGEVVFVPPSMPAAWREALTATGFEVTVSRCSGVDSALPATGRGAASVTRYRPDRRRALPLLLTTEAGGIVRWGDGPWDGRDPRSAPAGSCIAAVSKVVADRIAGALAGFQR